MLELHGFEFAAMGTACTLHLYAPTRSQAEAAASAAEEEVLRIEARYSRYSPYSYLTRINEVAAAGSTISADTETAALVDFAFACYARSDGLFDITAGVLREAWDFASGCLPQQSAIEVLLPSIGLDKVGWQAPQLTFSTPGMQLDFGGIAKEYAADRAAAVCAQNGVAYGLVDLGGDICVIGPHPDGRSWRIDIRHPRDASAFMASVELSRGALASSGDYERFIEIDGRRYCHLLDPHGGWPVHGLASVSVVAEQCLLAGSLSTIAMLKGDSGMNWLRGIGVPYCAMDEQGRLEWSEPFQPVA